MVGESDLLDVLLGTFECRSTGVKWPSSLASKPRPVDPFLNEGTTLALHQSSDTMPVIKESLKIRK